MGRFFAAAGSAAAPLVETCAAMAAGIAPERARKVRREMDVEEEFFINTQHCRWKLFLGHGARIAGFRRALQGPDMKFARLWGHSRFEGQQVHKTEILGDRDVVEIHE
jgi:hypothetical protein